MAKSTQTTIENCHIDFEPIANSKRSGRNSQADVQWFRFRAVTDTPDGPHIVRYSKRISINSMPDGSIFPQESDSMHVSMWQQLVDTMQQDGWQLDSAIAGDNWWESQLQRVTHHTTGRRWPWIVLATIIFLTVATVFYNVLPSPLYMRRVVPLAEMGLVESAETPQLTGKILLLNADTNRVDPLHAELPETIAATSRSEADSAVWVGCESKITQDTRLISNCKATVVDMLAGIRYESVELPNATNRALTINGGILSMAAYVPNTRKVKIYELRSERAILDYINSLPHQSP